MQLLQTALDSLPLTPNFVSPFSVKVWPQLKDIVIRDLRCSEDCKESDATKVTQLVCKGELPFLHLEAGPSSLSPLNKTTLKIPFYTDRRNFSTKLSQCGQRSVIFQNLEYYLPWTKVHFIK